MVTKPFHILSATMNSDILVLLFCIIFSQEAEKTTAKNSNILCTIHWSRGKLKCEATTWRNSPKSWDYLPQNLCLWNTLVSFWCHASSIDSDLVHLSSIFSSENMSWRQKMFYSLFVIIEDAGGAIIWWCYNLVIL